jgi:dihydroflavonol-4-reductase
LHTKVLVTGANGQLGRRLIPRLINAGYSVRAHYRNSEKAAKYAPTGIETITGDFRSPDWVERAIDGCQIVIHGAAKVSLRPGKLEEQRIVNIDGTKAVINACRKTGVRRLIYVSSIITVGASPDNNPVDETIPFNLGGYNVPYIDTKREAEELALAANSPELEVVVVNPSIMISPPDRPVTKRDLRKIPKILPAYFDFGLNVVETDDVISGIIAAIDKGHPGHRYLLTGENVDPERLFVLSKKYFGISKPIMKIPVSSLFPVALLVEAWAGLTGKRPKFHRGLAKLAHLRFFYSCDKAKRDLGYNPKPLEKTLENILGKLIM